HPTGYPLYTLLGYACSRLIPVGDAAYRVNVLSALTAALTAGLVYLSVVAGLRLVRPDGVWAGRISGLVAGGTLAASATFWEYSTVAEVYTLNALFLAAMAFLLVRWAVVRDRSTLFWAALCFGLSLTHHRTMLLLAPVFLLFIVALDWRALFQDLGRRLLAIVLPLLLYLYIPWRGLSTTSLDGQYQNTVPGFVQWTLGLYSAWWQRVESPAELGANLAAYRDLVMMDFTIVGVALALVGFLWLLWQIRPGSLSHTRRVAVKDENLSQTAAAPAAPNCGSGEPQFATRSHLRSRAGVGALALLLGLSYAGLTLFSVVYRGIGGFPAFFFIAPHVFLAMLVGIGVYASARPIALLLDRRQTADGRRRSAVCRRLLPVAYCLLFLLLPMFLITTNLPTHDMSHDTAVRDAGCDVMSQPLEPDAAIVGILGETTLVRYFQETHGLRPDLHPIPADSEEARLAAVTEQLAAGRAVYLTRPLPGAAGRWYLSSAGPLIRVRTQPEVAPPPTMSVRCDLEVANGVRFLGYDLAALNDGTEGPLPVESGKRLRVTLYWYPTRPITDDLLVFVHVLDAAGHRLGQDDAPPVRAAYPSSAWRPGEVVADTHDVRVLPGAPPGAYRLRVGWETPDGRALDVVVGSDVVGEFPVRRPTQPPSVADAQATIAHPIHVEFGDVVLLGHDLEPVTVRPGEPVSFATLWQARTAPGADYGLMIHLRDDSGTTHGTFFLPLSPDYPTSRWVAGEIVREHITFAVSPDLYPHVYMVELSVGVPDSAPSRTEWIQDITVSP
ncbi:MAG: DUF2723 domain-containing protein, partial [Chloroflexi bacterium]|nr:DUF2723 domain-containing protein [Chloroflexota bacterium]